MFVLVVLLVGAATANVVTNAAIEDKVEVDVVLNREAFPVAAAAAGFEPSQLHQVDAAEQSRRDDGTVAAEEAREGLGRFEPELVDGVKHAERASLAGLLEDGDVLQEVGPERVDAVEGSVALPDADDGGRLERVEGLGGEFAADQGFGGDAPFGLVHAAEDVADPRREDGGFLVGDGFGGGGGRAALAGVAQGVGAHHWDWDGGLAEVERGEGGR